jgi:Polysaccharide lyase
MGNTPRRPRRLRTRWSVFLAAVAAFATVPAFTASAGPLHTSHPAAPSPRAAAASTIWAADPSLGTKNFEGVELSPGKFSVVNDPKGTYGQTFKLETWENDGVKSRAETRGMRQPNGSVFKLDDSQVGKTFYVGWRSLWNPMPTKSGVWVALYQLHVDGQSSSQPSAGPFVLRTLGDGQLHFQYTPPSGADQHIWNGPLSLNKWNSFVIGFKLSRGSDGWISFWVNGVQQKFTNGSTKWSGATLWGDHVNNKWGVYRSGANTGTADAYLNSPKFGTTYDSVAP